MGVWLKGNMLKHTQSKTYICLAKDFFLDE